MVWKKSKREQDFWQDGERYIRIYGDELLIGPDSFGDSTTIRRGNYSKLKSEVKKLMELPITKWRTLL